MPAWAWEHVSEARVSSRERVMVVTCERVTTEEPLVTLLCCLLLGWSEHWAYPGLIIRGSSSSSSSSLLAPLPGSCDPCHLSPALPHHTQWCLLLIMLIQWQVITNHCPCCPLSVIASRLPGPPLLSEFCCLLLLRRKCWVAFWISIAELLSMLYWSHNWKCLWREKSEQTQCKFAAVNTTKV